MSKKWNYLQQKKRVIDLSHKMLTHPLCFGVKEGMQLDRTSLEVILLSVTQ